MPVRMQGFALGFVETRGYVSLIAATDVAVKAARVSVHSVQRATGGLVLITLVGDVASVQEAVSAAVQQAASVGELVSSHVIPRPDASVWKMLGIETEPEGDSCAGAAPDTLRDDSPPDMESEAVDAVEDDLDSTPVRKLRRMARSLPGMPLSGRDISRSCKAELIAAIRQARSR